MVRKPAPISWSRDDGKVVIPRPVEDDGDATWDQALAEGLVGCVVLIGLTHVEAHSTWKEEIFGTVETVDHEDGIAVRIQGKTLGGQLYRLPPDLRDFREKACPGDYRLRSTAEVVTNPDYTTTWMIKSASTSH